MQDGNPVFNRPWQASPERGRFFPRSYTAILRGTRFGRLPRNYTAGLLVDTPKWAKASNSPMGIGACGAINTDLTLADRSWTGGSAVSRYASHLMGVVAWQFLQHRLLLVISPTVDSHPVHDRNRSKPVWKRGKMNIRVTREAPV